MARSSTTFRPGPDARLHEFTRAERQLGYCRAVWEGPSFAISAWVWRKVRGYYRARKGR